MLAEPKDHIFIVEDNEIYSMMLNYTLSNDTVYNFTSFNSGEECLKNLNMNPVAVILDYSLPGINGYEALQAIKKYNENIHVIIISNIEDTRLAIKLLAAGASDYFLKKEHPEKKIIARIEALLNPSDIEQGVNTQVTKRKWRTSDFIILIISLGIIIAIYYLLK